jgi:hypothetical protein
VVQWPGPIVEEAVYMKETTMPKYDGKYVILLDCDLGAFPDTWKIIRWADSLASLDTDSPFSRGDPPVAEVDRANYDARLVKTFRLPCDDGKTYPAGQYVLSAKGTGRRTP